MMPAPRPDGEPDLDAAVEELHRQVTVLQRQIADLRDELPQLIRLGLMGVIKSPQNMSYAGDTLQTRKDEATTCKHDILLARAELRRERSPEAQADVKIEVSDMLTDPPSAVVRDVSPPPVVPEVPELDPMRPPDWLEDDTAFLAAAVNWDGDAL